MLQINTNFCGTFDDVGALTAVWVDTAKIMPLSSQVLINYSDDQNGFLGRVHSSKLLEKFLFPLTIFFSELLFSSV